jgi:CheY-like chemotaxis protein
MFEKDSILIVEDNVYLGLDLSNAVEDLNGRAVGPARTVPEALSLLTNQRISGAVVDFDLEEQDASPVAAHLASQGVPFVLHSCVDLPAELTCLYPDVPLRFSNSCCPKSTGHV